MSTLLEVQHLKKYFDVKSGVLHAVDDVSFSIEKGETLGVVGESGCGKSTLGRVLLHLLDNTGGRILYKGEDVTKVSRQKLSELRKEMQIIFQDPYASLNPRMTIYQTIEEPMKIAGGYSKKAMEERVYEIMDTVGLARRLVNTYPHELDGGRRQRIGIARALVLNPKFIVCDEPVSALDVSIQAQVVNVLEDLQQELGLTYLFVAHDLSMVRHISDRIGVMYLGKIVESGESDEVYDNPCHPYTRALLASIPIADPKRALSLEHCGIEGDLPSPLHVPSGCRFHTRCPYATDQCRQQEPELEERTPGHMVACWKK